MQLKERSLSFGIFLIEGKKKLTLSKASKTRLFKENSSFLIHRKHNFILKHETDSRVAQLRKNDQYNFHLVKIFNFVNLFDIRYIC